MIIGNVLPAGEVGLLLLLFGGDGYGLHAEEVGFMVTPPRGEGCMVTPCWGRGWVAWLLPAGE